MSIAKNIASSERVADRFPVVRSTVQRAIEAQERIIQTTTELKKALMHKLFTEGSRNEAGRLHAQK